MACNNDLEENTDQIEPNVEKRAENTSAPRNTARSTVTKQSSNKTLLEPGSNSVFTSNQHNTNSSNLSENTTLFTGNSKISNVNSEKLTQRKQLNTVDETIEEESEEEEYNINVFGKPLRVVSALHNEEYMSNSIDTHTVSTKTLNSKEGIDNNSNIDSSTSMKEKTAALNVRKTVIEIQKLSVLCDTLSIVIDDIHQNVKSISKASMSFIEILKEFIDENNQNKLDMISLKNNIYLIRIFKMVLHLCDNFLVKEVYQTTRAILLTKFLQFSQIFNLKIHSEADLMSNEDVRVTLPFLQLFPVVTKSQELKKIIDGIINSSETSFISENEGAFIAPVQRGLTSECSILSVMFGIPEETSVNQLDIITSLYSLFPDIHFYCVKDHITSCNTTSSIQPRQTSLDKLQNNTNTFASTNVNLPYRVPRDYSNPPISLSISTLNRKTKMSGTLGGFIQPIITEDSPKSLKHYANHTYGVTCAHVILSESQDYPQIAVPSIILQERYKRNLKSAQEQYLKDSEQFDLFSKEIEKIDYFIDSQFAKPIGQVIWGERCILSNNKLSDFAIIKMNDFVSLKNGNHLGDDAIETIGDPSLRFDNGYIKDHLHIDDLTPGIEVFKYGSSTKFTKGYLNGHKMVYWSDGKLQSSEFVINSLDNNPLFATGGDSGSFVLTKDKTKLGLSVVGMLHSYDGELKQLGLFTPMHNVLERLKSVTKVEWEIKKQSKI